MKYRDSYTAKLVLLPNKVDTNWRCAHLAAPSALLLRVQLDVRSLHRIAQWQCRIERRGADTRGDDEW